VLPILIAMIIPFQVIGYCIIQLLECMITTVSAEKTLVVNFREEHAIEFDAGVWRQSLAQVLYVSLAVHTQPKSNLSFQKRD